MKKSSTYKNNFSDFQDELVTTRVRLIESQLKILKKSKVKVKKISNLAELVAVHLSSVQNSPCSTSTLLRNEKYKGLLKKFMAERDRPSQKTDDDSLSALPLHVRIELSNLRNEVARLKMYIGKNEKGVSELDEYNTVSLLERPATAGHEIGIDKLEIAFAQSCQIIRSLLSYWKDYMGIDVVKGEIVDLSFRRTDPRSVIVASDAAKEFFEWLKKSELR